MVSLEPFWALEAAELRRRTFHMGMRPSFALVHVLQGPDGGTLCSANSADESRKKPFGNKRAKGFEAMIAPFVGKPGIKNLAFAINELAEPRVLVPWEEKSHIDEILSNSKSTLIGFRHGDL